MTDQELKDLVASLAISQAKTDEQLKELKASNQRMEMLLENIANNQGDITEEFFYNANDQGDVAEEFFYNSLENKMNLGGIHYDFIDQNWKRSNKALCDEFDIIMVNGKDIAIIEVKYKAHEKDLEKLLTKKQENFKELFPIYKDYNHHLALASFYMPPELKEKALENNVIVLQRKGDVMETFLPKNP